MILYMNLSMKIEIRDIINPIDSELEAMLLWQNDPHIRYLFRYFNDSEEYHRLVTIENFKLEMNDKKYLRSGLYVNDKIVGEFNFTFNHPAILKKNPKTAWIGIVIGDSNLHGQGLGNLAIEYLENKIKNSGGDRIELGVFEFNQSAIRFYEKLGYTRFKVIPDFTWWDGKFWSDYRYEKQL